jgi:hypothetical protein
MHGNKSTMSNKCTFFAGHFDGHARCHHMPPLVEYSPCIAPADAMVIDFGSKNQVVYGCGETLAKQPMSR